MKLKLGKGIIIVFVANIINLVFNMLTNLIVPKYLSVDSYAAIKTYQLYMSYIGILHLGYNDGMFLRYGGKSLSAIHKSELSGGISNIRLFLLLIALLGVIISFFTEDKILLMVMLAMLPTNLLSYFQFLYQACGEYSLYGRIINFISIGTFLINTILIFFVASDNYTLYLVGYILLNYGIWIFTEFFFHKITATKISISHFSLTELVNGMKSGILLTLGNFSSVFMTTMDRLFVRYLIGTVAFAQYSFAVSMENFLNTAITPVTITLYNHFCNYDEKKSNDDIRQRVIVFASIIIVTAYPVKFILEIYLKKYYQSSTVLFLLFASQMFYVVIKGIYVNLYKARKKQKKYFADLIYVIIFGFIANLIGYFTLRIQEAFAIATLLASIFWLIKCQFEYKDFTYKEYAYMFIQLAVFLLTGLLLNSIVGGVLYTMWTLVAINMFMKPVLKWGISILFSLKNDRITDIE